MRCTSHSYFKLHNLIRDRGNSFSIFRKWSLISSKHLAISAGSGLESESVNGSLTEGITEHPSYAAETFIKWGFTSNDLKLIFKRCPVLVNAQADGLRAKYDVLKNLGFTYSDLIRIISCRPSLFSSHAHCLEERIVSFANFFGSKGILKSLVFRNPSLLTYDLHVNVIPVFSQYEKLRVRKEELIQMLMSRPTVIARTCFDDKKIEYVQKLKISNQSKMYKYAVTLIGVSRLQTIREKFSNFEKFGFSEDEVLDLFGRSPLILTLSIEKVQRNMTYLLATLNLPASAVLDYPFLLYANLDSMIRPRVCLAAKLKELGLEPRIYGHMLFTALRMKEKRFINAFITCHSEEISNTLMEHYMNAKGVRRVGSTSKRDQYPGFPF